MALQIDQDRSERLSTSEWSGKGNGVAAIPSPKNRTGGFLHIRLKPFIPPVLLDAVSPQRYLGCEFADGRLGVTRHGFLHDLILLWIAKEYGGYASQ